MLYTLHNLSVQNAQLRQGAEAPSAPAAAPPSATAEPTPSAELEMRVRQLEATLQLKDRIRAELQQKSDALANENTQLKATVRNSLFLYYKIK